jgi:hypothetical protein
MRTLRPFGFSACGRFDRMLNSGARAINGQRRMANVVSLPSNPHCA